MSIVAAPDDGLLGRSLAPAGSLGTRRGVGGSRWESLTPVRLVAQVGQAALIWLAVFVPYAVTHRLSAAALIFVSVAAAIWLATLNRAFAACYRAIGVGLTAMIGTGSGLVVVAAVTSQFPGAAVDPWTLLGTTVGVYASAGVWEWVVQQTSVGRRRVLVVGTEALGETLSSEIASSRARFDVVGCFDGAPDASVAVPGNALAELTAIVEAQRPDLVVLADERLYADAVDRLLDAPRPGFRVVGLSTFFEYALGRVPLHHVTPAWFMAVLHLHQRPYARWSKRSFDLVLSCTVLALALPLLPLIALAVWATGGPVIYRQTRLGEGGRPFTVYKFRTMRRDAEQPGCPQFAAADDQRATTVGRFLRRTHLDELPQLWNVISGDMSIVGPRPERPEFVAILEAAVPFWTRRLLVKPGVTGWAQVSAGYAADCATAAEKLSYDLWYIRHRRLAIDIAVCLRTCTMMLRSFLALGPHARSCARTASEQPAVGD
jgi:exopolysaccharide biosynthesis polyprenyl glycosylphosphotransferase